MKKVIMFASSHLIGLTSQLTEQACGINKKIGSNLLIISGEKEQYPGLMDKSALPQHLVFDMRGFCYQ